MLSFIYKILLLICLVSIEFLATTTLEIKVVENMWDKSNHFVAFLTLYVLLSLSYRYLAIYKKVLWLLLFAIQIEVVQYFIEGRYFSVLDIVADGIGIVMGIYLFKLIAMSKIKL